MNREVAIRTMGAAGTDGSAMATTRLRRFCFTLDLKDDPESIERCRWWHRSGGPPAAVSRELRE
jgi:hypothetical protein